MDLTEVSSSGTHQTVDSVSSIAPAPSLMSDKQDGFSSPGSSLLSQTPESTRSFYIVRPPPSVHHSPLNLQVQSLGPPRAATATSQSVASDKTTTSGRSPSLRRRVIPHFDLHFPHHFSQVRQPCIRRLDNAVGSTTTVARFVNITQRRFARGLKKPTKGVRLLSSDLDGDASAEPLAGLPQEIKMSVGKGSASQSIRHVGWRWIYRPRRHQIGDGTDPREALVLEWTRNQPATGDLTPLDATHAKFTCHLITLTGSIVYMGELRKPESSPVVAKVNIVSPLPIEMKMSEAAIQELLICTAMWTAVREGFAGIEGKAAMESVSSLSLINTNDYAEDSHDNEQEDQQIAAFGTQVKQRLGRLFSGSKVVAAST